MANHALNQGVYHALINQLDKLARHNRQGSYRTHDHYCEAMKRFCRFLAEEYHLQKLTNISPRHLATYIEYLQENGKAASAVKTDLAAIHFWHDKMDRPKYRLPNNDELAVELERRRLGGVDRTWSKGEFGKFLFKCWDEGREDYAAAACLAYFSARTYQELIDTGYSPLNASLRVSHLLGHERPDVTNIYLASVKSNAARRDNGRKNEETISNDEGR